MYVSECGTFFFLTFYLLKSIDCLILLYFLNSSVSGFLLSGYILMLLWLTVDTLT